MGWMPTDTATRYVMGLPTLLESETAKKRGTDTSNQSAEEQTRRELERMRGYSAENVATISGEAQKEAARIRAAAGYNQGGAVKDPRASRRMYAKGGPVFR